VDKLKRTGFKPRTAPMARGTSTLKAKAPMARGAGMKSSSQLSRAVAPPSSKPKPKKSSRGMKGRAPTAAEQRYMDQAGAVPCLACTKDGIHNDHTSLHHTDGRTKPGAHFKTMPLCAPHHQPDDTDPMGRPSVHEHYGEFKARYGTEAVLLAELHALLGFVLPSV
jgi:hypothetical protein